jgi:hypothetical protein
MGQRPENGNTIPGGVLIFSSPWGSDRLNKRPVILSSTASIVIKRQGRELDTQIHLMWKFKRKSLYIFMARCSVNLTVNSECDKTTWTKQMFRSKKKLGCCVSNWKISGGSNESPRPVPGICLVPTKVYIILVNNQLDAQFFFLFVHFNSLHVSSNLVLIIRRISCINIISGMCHPV